MKTSVVGIDLIKGFEGFRNKMYILEGIAHIGYGHVILLFAGEENLMADTITDAQATQILANDLQKAEIIVDSQITVPLTQNQYDALVSLIFNIGGGAFTSSTLKGRINSGFSKEDITEAWQRWNKSNGSVNPVLVKRRQQEIDLYFSSEKKNG